MPTFGKFFRDKPAEPADPPPMDPSPEGVEAMDRYIEKQSKHDPEIKLKMGAGMLTAQWVNALKSLGRTRLEPLLGALGSLAGFSCQMAVREQARLMGQPAERTTLVEVTLKDGRRVFFGDPLNQLLLEGPRSIWSLAAGGAQVAGASDLLDIREIADYVSKSVGTDKFGIPRLPAEHDIGPTPAEIVQAGWPISLPTLQKYCDQPEQWPLMLGIGIQRVIVNNRAPPSLMLKIVMECAVPAAKFDPRELGIAAPP